MPTRTSVSIVVALAACTWALVLVVTGNEITWSLAKPFSLVVGVVSLGLAAFDRVLWRLWPVRLVHSRPDLRGTYWGSVRSQWINPASGKVLAPLDGAMVITQTFSGLALTLFTAESSSTTMTATLERGADGRVSLVGVYRNDPRLTLQERSRVHCGALRLDVSGQEPRLQGSYWTDRDTRGELEFTRIATARVTSFSEAKARVQPGRTLQ